MDMGRVQARVDELVSKLALAHETHVELRRQCEQRGIDVGPAAKVELVASDERKEVSARWPHRHPLAPICATSPSLDSRRWSGFVKPWAT